MVAQALVIECLFYLCGMNAPQWEALPLRTAAEVLELLERAARALGGRIEGSRRRGGWRVAS